MFQYYMGIPDIDGPYWTLIIELVFYIFMLALLITKNVRHIEKASTVFFLLVLVYSCFFNFTHNDDFFRKIGIAIPLIKYFPLFFSGILIYKLKFEKKTIGRFCLLALCYIVQLSLFAKCYKIRGFMSFEGYTLMLTIYYSIFILFLYDKLGFIVNKITARLGEISYSLYLIHQFISIKIIIPAALKYGCSFWIAALLALCISVSLALLINKFIEKPSLKLIRDWYNNKEGKKTVGNIELKPSLA